MCECHPRAGILAGPGTVFLFVSLLTGSCSLLVDLRLIVADWYVWITESEQNDATGHGRPPQTWANAIFLEARVVQRDTRRPSPRDERLSGALSPLRAANHIHV